MDTRPTVARRASARRITVFVTVVLAIALGANWMVLATWNSFHAVSNVPLWQLMFPVLTVTFILTTIVGTRISNLLLRMIYRICAVWMGLLSLLFFAAVFCCILYWLMVLLDMSPSPQSLSQFTYGLALVVGAYALLNAARIRITPVTIQLANLPTTWQGRTAALVTDLHLGNVRGAGFVRGIVGRLNQLQPEVVFISGDMFDGTLADYGTMVAAWRNLVAPRGAYFVTGNHEEFRDREPFLEVIQKIGIRVLNNEVVDLAGLQVVGIPDSDATDGATLRAILASLRYDRSRPTVLLAHQPANLETVAEAGISLQLSGHTHGGQMWPWTWVGALVHGRFNYGLNRHGTLQTYTSSGVGTWGPPLRWGTKSEIVLLRFEAAKL